MCISVCVSVCVVRMILSVLDMLSLDACGSFQRRCPVRRTMKLGHGENSLYIRQMNENGRALGCKYRPVSHHCTIIQLLSCR